MMLNTMPNHYPAVATQQEHELQLPSCCPVSKNPRSGSFIRIHYRPAAKHLEVYSLKELIDSFVGGQKCPHSGAVVIRDMEGMIQSIAQQCADAVGVEVHVNAHLILNDEPVETIQAMRLDCVATPKPSGNIVLPIVRDIGRLRCCVIQTLGGVQLNVGVLPTLQPPPTLVWRKRIFFSVSAQYQEIDAVEYLESTFLSVDDISSGDLVRLTNLAGTSFSNVLVPRDPDGGLPGVIRYRDRFYFVSGDHQYEEAIYAVAFDME
jgi:hypothetical protein